MARLSSLLVAIVFLAQLNSGLAADVRYRITDLGDLTRDRQHGVTFVSGINEPGDVVGQTFDDRLRARAFMWRDGRMTDLGDFGSINGEAPALSAFAINKRRDIVGTAVGSGATSMARGFLWSHGLIVNLGTLRASNTDTFAAAINEHGDIVGAGFRSAGDLRALRWILGIPTELGGLPDGRVAVQAFGINGHGEIVGYLSPGGPAAFAHAFLWKQGKFTDLGTLPGTNLSFANAVNEKDQVVGQSLKTSLPQAARAFLWEAGTLLDLGKAAPSHTTSEARAINKQGTVVGTSGSGATKAAWIWQEGVTRDLNALVAPDDPGRGFVQLQLAAGINDKGQIAAQGYDRRRGSAIVRGYLLTPVKGK